MNQPSKNTSYALSLVLYVGIIIVCATPVMLQSVCRPEQSLFCTIGWQNVTKNGREDSWNESDGSSPQHVSLVSAEEGVTVNIHPTEATTREAYFSESLIPGNIFKLSTEINVPCGYLSGLVFRGNAQGEYYLFLVSSTTYTVEILQRKSGGDLPREAILPNAKISGEIGQPRNLTVVGKSQTYYFYINGVYVDQMSDSRLYGYRVGVEVFT